MRRLIIMRHAKADRDPVHDDDHERPLTPRGVEACRLLAGHIHAHDWAIERVLCSTARRDHLMAFADIDISLDPFPQNGGVSTWESLYLGVPVVARLGNGTASRISGALLNALGLDDWVASDDDGYLAIAERFASMPAELEKLRADLPARIANSPAGNIAVYTERVEAGYRQFWRDYCATASGAA